DRSGGLAVGDAYSRSETMFAPPSLNGRFNVFVRTDSQTVVFENNFESNNTLTASAPLDVIPFPYADLKIVELDAPAGGESGKPLTVTWTVRNDGIGSTNSIAWSDTLKLTS